MAAGWDSFKLVIVSFGPFVLAAIEVAMYDVQRWAGLIGRVAKSPCSCGRSQLCWLDKQIGGSSSAIFADPKAIVVHPVLVRISGMLHFARQYNSAFPVWTLI